MSRSVKEWIGKSDDDRPPPRVRLRIFLKFGGRCACCGIKIDHKPWELDHKIALINGGENRENNFHPLLVEHHRAKTKEDTALKAKTYKKRLKHLGLKKPKGKPMMGTKASGWKRTFSGEWKRR